MKTWSLSSVLKDVIAACEDDLEVIKERRAAMKARLDNAAALDGIDPAAVRRHLAWRRKAAKNEIDRDRNDEIDTIYRIIASGGVPVLPSRSDSELDRVLALTNTNKPPTIAAIRQAIGCSQGKASKLHKSAAARLEAKSSSSRGIDEHELLTEQERPSDGPRLGKFQKRQIELLERAAAKKATLPHEPETGEIAAKSSSSRGIDEHELLTEQDRPSDEPRVGELEKGQLEPLEPAAAKTATLPHEPETGEIVEPRKGADDDGLEIPNFLKRLLPGRMVTP
jgi:hypothetical protein